MFGYICDIALVWLVYWSITKKRTTGYQRMLVAMPWNLLNNGFRRNFNVECQLMAKFLRNKYKYDKEDTSEMYSFSSLMLYLMMLLTAAFGVAFCNKYLASAYIVYLLLRVPMLYYGHVGLKKYLDHPELIGRVC